jgi:transcriptional regulator with XRE-family HTH domain
VPRSRIAHRATPQSILDSIKRVGENVRAARLRRQWTEEELAQKAGISRLTLRSLERGSPGVGLSALVSTLWAMGLNGSLGRLASREEDTEGATLVESRLGSRVHRSTADDDF